MRVSISPLLGLLLFYSAVSKAQPNLVLLNSPPGDYIGQGSTYITTNASEFGFDGTETGVSVSAFGFYIEFDGPGNNSLMVAKYTNAVRYPFNGDLPGISVFGNGRGCNTVAGTFEILEMHVDGTGKVDRFWVTFSHSCEGSMPPLKGEVRYHSVLAPAAPAPRTLRVPAEYPTIQMAIDDANVLSVDTVLVAPGIYAESIQFRGKRARVVSEHGPELTVISSPPGTWAVTMSSGETADAVFSGFTLTNCSGGVYCAYSAPTISSNTLINCGTGVAAHFASPTILRNIIRDSSGAAVDLGGAATPIIEGNLIERSGVGVTMFAAGSPTIRNNVIRRNHGNGIDMVNQSDADIIQNVIAENENSGIYWLVPSGARGPWVVHNTIVNNGRVSGSGIDADGYDASARIINNIVIGTPGLTIGYFNDANPPIIQFNNILSGTNGNAYEGITNLIGVAGNISALPIFLQPDLLDFRLQAGSPGIDAGTSNQTVASDLDGNPRPADGDQTPPALPDMGAYEYNPGPPRPATLVHTLATLTNVVIDWRPFDGSTNYILRRATNSGGPYAFVGSTSGTNFTDSLVVPDLVYFYVVAGENALGVGANSTESRVKAGNHPPVAADDLLVINEDEPATFTPLTNDNDADGDSLSLELLSPAGDAQTSISNVWITFVPALNFTGTNVFSYRIADGRGASATGTITVVIRPVNDAPIVQSFGWSTFQDTPVTNFVSATDVDSTNLQFTLSTPPSHGLASLDSSTGRLIYRPAHGYFGFDSLQYVAFDGLTNSVPAVVGFNVLRAVDSDRDGMPDWWENLWDLNNPNNDPDGDGLTSLQEYLANTKPRDADSVLKITVFRADLAGNWMLTWASVGGSRYRIYWSDDLTALGGGFQPLLRTAAEEIDPAMDGVSSTQTFIDKRPPPFSGSRFYKVTVVQ